MIPGRVSIVGAGPGDPGLLTLRAAERLREAEDVVHDALVSPAVLALAAPGAVLHDAGKRDGRHVLPQEEIAALLIRLARSGRRVVRLKGGDPFLFGRGGEEIEALSAAGVEWELVPGVSSCIAAPAAAGIPVTDRRFSSMLTVVTGNACVGLGGAPGVDWERISPKGTLVVLMGVRGMAAIRDRLLGLGWPADVPAALVSGAGWPGERTVVSTLAGLPEAAAGADAGSPGVIVVGEVVRMRERVRGGVDVEEARA